MENQPPGEGSGASDVAGQSSDSTIQLNTKTLVSRTFSFHVDENISVLDFKEKIASQVDVPTGQQHLLFRGKALEDDHRLSEYNVEHGDTLHLVERQPLPPAGPNTGDTTSSNSTGGPDPSAGGTHNLIRLLTDSVIQETLHVGDPVLSVEDVTRVIGLLSSIADDAHPVQDPHGNETEQAQAQSQTNAGSQSQGGIQFGPLQVGQSGSNSLQNSAGIAIPVATRNYHIPHSLDTLTELMNRMELTLSENGSQENQSPSAIGSLPTQELPVNLSGYPTVEALTTVLRHAQRLLSNHVVPTLSRTAGRLDQEGGPSDPAVLMESVSLGFTMQDLGALLLELGRTVLTLRIHQSTGESSVSAGPAIYISPFGPNYCMIQPTRPLFGGSPGVTQNHVPVGPFGNIHSGESLAHLVPVIGNRAPNVEERQGQRVNEAPGRSSVSVSVPQINTQLRNLAANMESGNHASSGGVSNQEQPAVGGIKDDETTQTSAMDKQKANNDTSTAPDGGSHNRSSMSGQAESLEGPSVSSQGNSNQDGSSVIPLGLGLEELQPKRRDSQSRSQDNNIDGASSSTAVGQQFLQSLASPSSRGGENPPTFSGEPSHPARDVFGDMPIARQNSNNGNIDIVDAMSQALGSSSLDGVLAGVSQQRGIGSPNMLRNMLQQLTQNPEMRYGMNYIAQQIDDQDLAGVGDQGGGGYDLSRMMQMMMPIVTRAFDSRSQINFHLVTQRLEASSSAEVFECVFKRAAELAGNEFSSSNERIVNELFVRVLAQDFLDILLFDLSRRLH